MRKNKGEEEEEEDEEEEEEEEEDNGELGGLFGKRVLRFLGSLGRSWGALGSFPSALGAILEGMNQRRGVAH
eukprot:9480248-Pyramimonas_sp.AAC.1